MDMPAIILMVVSLVLVWGGLVLNILKLRYRKAPHEVLEAAREAEAWQQAIYSQQAYPAGSAPAQKPQAPQQPDSAS